MKTHLRWSNLRTCAFVSAASLVGIAAFAADTVPWVSLEDAAVSKMITVHDCTNSDGKYQCLVTNLTTRPIDLYEDLHLRLSGYDKDGVKVGQQPEALWDKLDPKGTSRVTVGFAHVGAARIVITAGRPGS